MGVNTRNMYSCLQKYNKLNKSHLVGQLLNSNHDERTHVYIKKTVNLVYKTIQHPSINETSLLNDHINCIIILLLLVELHCFIII